MSWESDLQDWAETRTADAPTPEEADALVARARVRRPPATRRITGFAVVAMAAAAIVFVLAQPAESPTGWTWTPRAPLATSTPVPPEPVPLPPGTHQLDDDELQVASDSTVVALQTGPNTRLRLDAGTVSARVAHRTGAETFAIETDAHTVTVIGTEFSVQHRPFSVRVSRGTVVVQRSKDGARWNVTAGESFIDGKVQRPVRVKAPPTLSDLQQMVLDGSLSEARAGLKRRLQDQPEEAASWRLLAQIEERSGDTDAALEAWMTVIRTGSAPHAQGARYEAARLLEAEPHRAIPLLVEFLASPHPLSGEARLRLADAYDAADRPEEARTVLEEAARLHAGTSIGRKAQRRLR